ncbi:hypothetical protein MJH12_15520, partial [bacterium]|nr:hypothetical protein [bacterium]
MEAVINSNFSGFSIPQSNHCTSGNMLLNKPIITHVIEKLLELKVSKVTILTNSHLEELKSVFLSGENYGISIDILLCSKAMIMKVVQGSNQKSDTLYIDDKFCPQLTFSHLQAIRYQNTMCKINSNSKK